ncbi:MAG: A/G-specific adenine glycosylase [Flexibacteraceae bacterium]
MHFSNTILHWFKKNKRNLPWRNTTDPYKIWLSEIILQQTRVAQGLPYYEKFVHNYPDIKALANAADDEVLRDWQGLGYYSRARNMHATAKFVVEHLNGQFPDKYVELLKLKGIGSYTAAAIASFSSNEAVAVLDGNVFRVLARYFGLSLDILSNEGKKQFQELANSQLPQDKAADHNQAIMEFGALQCVPKNPNCLACPLKDTCIAFDQKQVDILPVKLKKLAIKHRYLYYFLPMYNSSPILMMRRRGSGDVWEGLYDMPSLESEKPLLEGSLVTEFSERFLNRNHEKDLEFNNCFTHYSPEFKHQLTHQKLFIRFINISEVFFPEFEDWCLKNGYLAYSLDEANNLPKPIIIANYLANKNSTNSLTII